MKAAKISVIGNRNRIDGSAMPFGDYDNDRYWLLIEGDNVYALRNGKKQKLLLPVSYVHGQRSRGAWVTTEVTKNSLKLKRTRREGVEALWTVHCPVCDSESIFRDHAEAQEQEAHMARVIKAEYAKRFG